MHFLGQKRRFRVFEEGYCKDFKKLISNFIEASKNFDLIFSTCSKASNNFETIQQI
jgi:hypothetical protein